MISNDRSARLPVPTVRLKQDSTNAARITTLHSQPDEVCLDRAISIRLVLTEMAGRLQLALKEKKELEEAVTKLLR